MRDIKDRLRSDRGAGKTHWDDCAEAADRIAELEVSVRRAIACIEMFKPWVNWDGLDGEEEEARVELTLTLLREAVRSPKSTT